MIDHARREYLDTHPWLTFDVERQLHDAPPRLWQLVGKVVALAQHLAETPMLPDYAQRMHAIYMIKGAVATTQIEGNTLSEDDVERLLDKQLTLPPSKEYLGIEVRNMLSIFNGIMSDCASGIERQVTPATIKQHNVDVLRDLVLEPGVIPGEVSEHGVVVGPYRGAPRRDCEYLLERLCEWLLLGVPDAGDVTPMASAVIRAILAHLYLAWIHAFGDGNGRTARLVEFQILAAGGVPGPAAHLLSNHFNDTRTEYYRQLNHASRSGGEVVPFLMYALQGFYDGLQYQLSELRGQNEELLWRELVDRTIPGHKPTEGRQRQLAIAMFRYRGRDEALRRGEMMDLTTDLARRYGDRTPKTLSRDITALMMNGLIKEEGRRSYRVTERQILGLMPMRARSPHLS